MLLRSFKTLWCASTVAPERVVSGPNLLRDRVTLATLAVLYMVLLSEDPAKPRSLEVVLYTFLLFLLFFMSSTASYPHDYEAGFSPSNDSWFQYCDVLIVSNIPFIADGVKNSALDTFYLALMTLYSPDIIEVSALCLI